MTDIPTHPVQTKLRVRQEQLTIVADQVTVQAIRVLQAKITKLCNEIHPWGDCLDVDEFHVVGVDGTTIDGHYVKFKLEYQITKPDDPIKAGWTRYWPPEKVNSSSPE